MTTMTTTRASSSTTIWGEPADAHRFRQLIDQAGREIPAAQVTLLTTMPRGGLQIIQPQRVGESMLKNYLHDLHAQDKTTWSAIVRRQPVRGSEVWGDALNQSEYAHRLLLPNGWYFEAAAVVDAPVFQGYPGALHVYRSETQGDFSHEELQQLQDLARQIASAAESSRRQRVEAPQPEPLGHQAPLKCLVFDHNLRQLIPCDSSLFPDEQLNHNVLQTVREHLESVKGTNPTGRRVQIPDSRGDLWNFRAVVFPTYPALSDGPVVFLCLLPEGREWGLLQPGDFQADRELARLIPALRFMQEQFHRGPTLVEIAKSVHLSPFHFHRRFTELLGLTPKHFMLDCQIAEAKRMLLARQRELSEIATECGFAHQSHFTSRFKQATGLTPTRWRRAALEARSSTK